MRVLVMIFVCLCFGLTSLVSQDNWAQGMQAYNNENYGKAATVMRTMVDEGKESVELYYNLANAYYKNKDYGNAVLFYERALRLDPHNAKIKENLGIVNKQLETKVSIIPEFFLAAYWKSFSSGLSSTMWSILQFLGLLLCVFGSYLWILKKEISTRKKGFSCLIGGAILALLSLLAGWTKYNIETTDSMAVIMSKEANLHKGPDSKSKSIMSLSEGVKVEILDQINTWNLVRLMDKEEGWVETSWLEVI